MSAAACVSPPRTIPSATTRDQTTGVNCQVTLTPVYENDPAKRDPENELFGKATPSASFTMLICNEHAHEALEMGKDYYIDISRVPVKEPV